MAWTELVKLAAFRTRGQAHATRTISRACGSTITPLAPQPATTSAAAHQMAEVLVPAFPLRPQGAQKSERPQSTRRQAPKNKKSPTRYRVGDKRLKPRRGSAKRRLDLPPS